MIDPVGANTKSVRVNNAQTGANYAKEVLPIFKQPLSPFGGAISSIIDNSQRLSAASSPQSTPIQST